MIVLAPVTLEGHGVRLEPLAEGHHDGLVSAASDGAKRDGVLRHHQARRDGTARDSVFYSLLVAEWPDVRRHLDLRLARGGPAGTGAGGRT
jgi:hypothetical protein